MTADDDRVRRYDLVAIYIRLGEIFDVGAKIGLKIDCLKSAQSRCGSSAPSIGHATHVVKFKLYEEKIKFFLQ